MKNNMKEELQILGLIMIAVGSLFVGFNSRTIWGVLGLVSVFIGMSLLHTN